jgi:hypothetical protein
MSGQRRFDFALATEADDAELRALLRKIAMPGNITLSFLREPSFFLAEQAGSTTSQVMVCKDRRKGQIVGVSSRNIRYVYIDGVPTRVGYLSMLRGMPEARGNIALARGYRYLQTLHGDGAVPYYFTTILDDNTEAKTLLTSERAGLPKYQPVARLVTYLIPLTKKRRWEKVNPQVSKIERHQLPDAIAFLQEWNSHHQFAPLYTLQDMLGQSSLLPCFSWQNFYVYREQDAFMGTLGVWDQQSFKQTVVTAYAKKMQLIRPGYNLLVTLQGTPRLPRVGSNINILYAAFLSGGSAVFAELLRQVCRDWSNRGYDYLAVGLCDDNDLYSIAHHYATRKIASTLYVVYWKDANVVLPDLRRPMHLEVATL